MIEVNKLFRKAVYEALNGNLTFDAAIVPVFDEKVIQAEGNSQYVILQSQSNTQQNTFSSFNTDTTLIIQVVAKSWDGVSKDPIDDISNQILQILFPTPNTTGLITQAGIQICNARLQSSSSGVVALQTNKYNVYKFLTVQALIIQS